ncbi:hypothetical protein CTI12_AA228390 [Artemisia annua]|uniref:Protein kinase domain-containing protein n=1 Tax=Artemisia annua TaxID=35608 RepID=A0A2U1NU08_ARTAN|nr:hypothetical protein CTI12_AA228390 [Artemisia annua]
MTSHVYTNMIFLPNDFAHLKIPLQNILSATNNFDEKNIIGTGEISNSYKGQLLWSGELIDIDAERLNKDMVDREQRFWMEISMLSSLKHKNLVSLVGFCDENHEKITITRREIKGSLNYHLSDSTRLTWVRRLEMSVGLANALSYIHYDQLRNFSVIHRKITSNAVLLNDNWEPKLYAFDRSMKIKASQRHHSFHTNNRATYVIGYADPTYIETKSVNHKSDMYSFGIVLLELLCGRLSIIDNKYYNQLVPLAITLYREKKLINIIDQELLKKMDLHSFNMFAEIVFECLDNERSRRPNIDDIVPRLEKALELQLKLYLMLQDNNSIVEGSSSSIHTEFQHLKIKLEAIKSATDKFDEAHCIGKGGFGTVYKGELVHSKGRSIVALKRLDRAFGQGNPEFWKEIIMLSLYHHDNIVSLLGFCDECGEMILVYEYASKRSLDLYLNDKDLTCQQRVLHRDIKSSNILLDENWNAKIADFGLSKFGPANQPYTFLVSNGVGTIGYCDPLYVESGLLTKESDVYSFGVVLFELLCGRLCIGNNRDELQPLTELVRKCYKQNTIDEIIYGNIKDEINPHSLKVFTTIAYQCLEREREQRPLMTKVVKVLESALQLQVYQYVLTWYCYFVVLLLRVSIQLVQFQTTDRNQSLKNNVSAQFGVWKWTFLD